MEDEAATVRRWWMVPPSALRGPFVLAFTLIFVTVSIVAGVSLDVALSMCSLGPCDATAQRALLLPLWWLMLLWGPDPPRGVALLAPLWWLLLTWIISRIAIELRLRYA